MARVVFHLPIIAFQFGTYINNLFQWLPLMPRMFPSVISGRSQSCDVVGEDDYTYITASN